MKDIQKIVQAFHDCDVPKDMALKIIYELSDNCNLYAGNQDAIDELLKSKLSIDSYIALRSYFIVG